MLVIIDVNPVLFEVGPFAIRWYGLFMAIFIGVSMYLFITGGSRQGIDEDFLYNLSLIAVLSAIAGARLIYVATNWSHYAADPVEIIRIDHGGLSFHGALGGGILATWLYSRAHKINMGRLLDLMVPGVAVGIALVRIGNLINGEVLGRVAANLPFPRHPAQLYGSAIGLILLVVYYVQNRRQPPHPAGYKFWSFVLYYQILRGVVEETFRANPLYAWGYVNTDWGIGFFTLTHLVTIPIVLLALFMMNRIVAGSKLSHGSDVGGEAGAAAGDNAPPAAPAADPRGKDARQ